MFGLDHFGLIAPFYDRVIGLQRAEKLISLLGLPVYGTILDAAGGTGRVAQILKGKARQVIVADVSIYMLTQAMRKGSLATVNSEVEQLPFQTGSFERIIMIDAMHHVEDQAATAREFWRVLKPGGRIVIEELDIRTLIVKCVAIFEKMALMRSHFISAEEISRLFPTMHIRKRIEREGYNAWIVVEKEAVE
jgi:ubiquinone/menaquinone biosynthesis C-methylase UbiE